MKLALAPWRWWRWLYEHYAQGVTAALALLVVVALVMTTVNSRADSQRNAEAIKAAKANAVTACENSNESREAARAMWGFIIDFSVASNPDPTPSESAFIGVFREYVGRVYALHDCQDLGREYPLPPPPSIPTEGNVMTQAKFEVKFSATAEVRDADGNLLSSTPVEFDHEMTEDNLRELGLTDEHITEIKEQDS